MTATLSLACRLIHCARLLLLACACEVQGVLVWRRFLIVTGRANYVYMRIQYFDMRVLSSAAGSDRDQPGREVRRD